MKGLVMKMNALDLLRRDHYSIKDSFQEYEYTEGRRAKKSLAQNAMNALKIHSVLEEEIFYPTVKEHLDEDEFIGRLKEDHHHEGSLIVELEDMEERGDEGYDAKFTALAESARRHIEWEENQLFPKVENCDVDLEHLGEHLAERKNELIGAAARFVGAGSGVARTP